LEARIIPDLIPNWIEPEQCRSKRYVFRKRAKPGFEEEATWGSLLLVRWLGFPSRTLGKL
jgi:hypothetical protein